MHRVSEHGKDPFEGAMVGSERTREQREKLLGGLREAAEQMQAEREGRVGPEAPSDWRNSEQNAADQRRQQNQERGQAAARERAERREKARAALEAAQPTVEPLDHTKDAMYDPVTGPQEDQDFTDRMVGAEAIPGVREKILGVENAWIEGEAEDKAKRKWWKPWTRESKSNREDRQFHEKERESKAAEAKVAAERAKVDAIVNAPGWADEQAAADARFRAREDRDHARAEGRVEHGPETLRTVESVNNYDRVRTAQEEQELMDLVDMDVDDISTPGLAVPRPEAPAAPRAPRQPLRERVAGQVKERAGRASARVGAQVDRIPRPRVNVTFTSPAREARAAAEAAGGAAAGEGPVARGAAGGGTEAREAPVAGAAPVSAEARPAAPEVVVSPSEVVVPPAPAETVVPQPEAGSPRPAPAGGSGEADRSSGVVPGSSEAPAVVAPSEHGGGERRGDVAAAEVGRFQQQVDALTANDTMQLQERLRALRTMAERTVPGASLHDARIAVDVDGGTEVSAGDYVRARIKALEAQARRSEGETT